MKRDGAHGKDTTTREREISLLQVLRLAESEHHLRHAAMASHKTRRGSREGYNYEGT